MSLKLYEENDIEAIANAIRYKINNGSPNLFNPNSSLNVEGSIGTGNFAYPYALGSPRMSYFMPVKSSTKYSISASQYGGRLYVFEFDRIVTEDEILEALQKGIDGELNTLVANRTKLGITNPVNDRSYSFTTGSNCKFIGVYYQLDRVSQDFQIVEGDITPYKPYDLKYKVREMSGAILGLLNRLPYEYEEVLYLRSTGTQYIDTEVKPYKTKINIKFQAISVGYILGTFEPNNNRYYPLVITSNRINVMNKDNNTVYYKTLDSDIHNVIYNDENNDVYFDNTNVGSVTDLSEQGTLNLFLFARNQSTGIATEFSNCKIYNIRITDKDTNQIIRDFIPCYRKSDNKPGMYDIINNKFYTNSGTDEFILPQNDIAVMSLNLFNIEKEEINNE